jgi:transcriptional regulator with XRE-family HTH domain
VSEKNPYLVELGQFLRARRSEVTPHDLGMAPREAGTRRVSGLRREEVADRVAISIDYYTRVEQGRLAPSEQVLEGIAHVLRLTPEQREFAEGLAQRAGQRTPPSPRSTSVRPQLQRLLDQVKDTPAIVVSKYLDILAWNKLAAAVVADYDSIPARERNYVRMLFTDPRFKDAYRDWESQARSAVALLRMQAVDNPTDPRLAALVGELSVAHPQFRRWWAARHVARPEFGDKVFRHPVVGDLTLGWDAYSWAGGPDQQLVLWSAEPGTSSHEKLCILSSWVTSAITPTAQGQTRPNS